MEKPVTYSTLLYEMPSNSKGKNFVWKIYWNFPLNLRVLPATDSDGSTCRFWWEYLQKVNAKYPQMSDEKHKFWQNMFSWIITFWPSYSKNTIIYFDYVEFLEKSRFLCRRKTSPHKSLVIILQSFPELEKNLWF